MALPSLFYFFIFVFSELQFLEICFTKTCHGWDLIRGLLVSEATALPTPLMFSNSCFAPNQKFNYLQTHGNVSPNNNDVFTRILHLYLPHLNKGDATWVVVP